MRAHHIARRARGCRSAARATAAAVQRTRNSPPIQSISSRLDVSLSSAAPVDAHRLTDTAVRLLLWTKPTSVLVVRGRVLVEVMAAMLPSSSPAVTANKLANLAKGAP